MSQKSRKIRAIAAGGAVLGVGAAITLAAWSDSEFADGLFNTSAFGIEAASQASGVDFGDHPEEGSALTLTFSDGGSLAPGDTVAVDYQVRNVEGGAASQVALAQEQTSSENTAFDNAVTASVLQTEDGACNSETTGTAMEVGDTFNLLDETSQNLCLQISLNENYEGTTAADGTIVWQFDATEYEETDQL